MDREDLDTWASNVVLADGGVVHLRPIRPDDDRGLLATFRRLSRESVYLRFFSPMPELSSAQLHHLTNVDYRDRFALVAELGDEIVGVARYDRIQGTGEAEVAFTVQDDQQGRGLGTIMLEHLAAVGRDRGLSRFVATTLPQNRRMLGVFRDAGFEVERAFEEGVVQVSFPIEPTERSIDAQLAREHHSEARSIQRILAPRSIAVIGAGRHHGTIGHELFRNLLAGEFAGSLFPIHPTAESVAGVRAYRRITDVPDDVDLAVVVVPAGSVDEVVQDCAAKNVRGLVVISAGFAELGGAHADEEHRLVETARRHGMRLVGPNCMGVINTNADVRMNATFAPYEPRPGRVAFSSQSGALGIELLGQAARLGLGISTFVSVGNKADVSGNDLLQYWEDDPDTDVILLYLESFGNPRKFARLARRVSRAKPIVAVKSGRSSAGRRAASSHTAALASPDNAIDALFHQAGVVRVDTLEQLLDTARVLAHQPLPAGRRLAIVSNGGGPGILAADAAEHAGLDVPELAETTQDVLRSFASPDATVRNPIDLVASAPAAHYEQALRAVLADPGVDAVLAIFVPPLVTEAVDVAAAITVAASTRPDKPVVACFLGRTGMLDALGGGDRAVPSFAFPESAVASIGRAADYADWRRRPQGSVPELAGIDLDRARDLVDAHAGSHPAGVWLDPDVATELCACFGLPVTPVRRVADAASAVEAADAFGYPVALKAASPRIVHKTDAGAVRVGLESADEVQSAFVELRAALGDRMGGAVVQPMIGDGIETIVGVTHDPSFGPLVLFGMGGVSAELLRDTAVRILPITDADAHELVRSLRTSPLLEGYRGSTRVDLAALEDVMVRIGRMADEVPEIVELDCNPVIASEHGVALVDVKVRLANCGPAPAGDLRRLRPS
ncbi:MAG: GNAT family N-acetyltransferase [Acidimicrobiia bacterium]